MPVVPDPVAPPDGRLLLDDAGRLLATFQASDRGGLRWAGQLALAAGVTAEDALPIVQRDLAGHRVSGPPGLGEALVARGAIRRRHARVMLRALDDHIVAAAPAGIRLTALDRPVADLVDSNVAAYPPGHPDFVPGEHTPAAVAERLAYVLSGAAVGPVIAASRLAIDGRDAVVGAALVTEALGPAPFTGAWLADLWRAPAAAPAGTGAALLAAALLGARAEGHAAIGLVVTEGNPARRLYERAGFTTVVERLNVDVP